MLWRFLALTFGLTWGIAGFAILFPELLERLSGRIGYTNPLFILAVYAPGIAGVLLVWRYHGITGIGRYLRRLTLWRMPRTWWLLLILGIPAIYFAGAALKGALQGRPDDLFPFSPWYAVLPAMAAALLIGPIEEFGWRGFALPLLQRRMAPFWAGLLLGLIWAIWHLPAFALSGTPQSEWSLPAFFVGVVALSVIMTPLFNATRGSLLAAALFHFQCNAPVWPDAQPWDTPLFVLAAAAVTWFNRKTLFDRRGAVTEILLEASPPRR